MVRAKAQAERFKRQKIRRPRSLAEAPEAAPAPAPRPPGTHAREIAHTEAIEYRYDPEGDTFDARVVDASEPVVTRWDGDPPARDERDVGRWDVVLTPMASTPSTLAVCQSLMMSARICAPGPRRRERPCRPRPHSAIGTTLTRGKRQLTSRRAATTPKASERAGM